MEKQKWCKEAAKRELESLIEGIPDTVIKISRIIPGEHKSHYISGTRISVTVVLDEALLDSWDIRNNKGEPTFKSILQIIITKMATMSETRFVAALLFAQKQPSIPDTLDYSTIKDE